ncbi:MAG: lipoyl synthase [Actinomycetaceae bacterium]|nr:lipoyl synthase [Actinomycetaceae bacterium]MDU0970791.1 lipoyl synthase [Actinomycetaceae bacterium]
MSTIPEPEGRRQLRIEVANAATPIEKKPKWIRTQAVAGPNYHDMRSRSISNGLHTVCAEAGCPNIFECWQDREATFLIGGAFCTRRCDFCDIAHGKPVGLDKDEPARIGDQVAQLGLNYVTITGVARDDLPDGASWLYAETCRQIKAKNPGTGVELLVDDFRGDPEAVAAVCESQPEVFAHNLETVPRLLKRIRPAFRYERTLGVIEQAHEAGLITKSNLMLGFGETTEELEEVMCDLVDAGCDLLTITQYLRPSPNHHPVVRWVKPQEFVELSKMARRIGFSGVMAGPLVRSSYRAGRLWAKAMKAYGRPLPESLAHLGEEGPALQEASALLARDGQAAAIRSSAALPACG